MADPLSDNGLAPRLAAQIGEGGRNLTVHLATAPVEADNDTDPALLVEAVFDGYAPGAAAWSAPTAYPDGTVRAATVHPYHWTLRVAEPVGIRLTAWWLTRADAPTAAVVCIAPLRPQPVLTERGSSVELGLGLTAALDVTDGATVALTWDAVLSFKARRIRPAARARWKALQGALHGVWRGDQLAAGKQTAHKTEEIFFALDPLAAEAMRIVEERCAELLRRKRETRLVYPPAEAFPGGLLFPKD